jgi:putative cardiolipin synthase
VTSHSSERRGVAHAVIALGVAVLILLGGCASLPPGLDAPKPESTALAHPETTALGRQVQTQASRHAGLSGFRLLVDGTDSFALRLSLARRAQRTIDAQYFIFRQDDTGKLLLAALGEAADRGVRVRLLIDDAIAHEDDSVITPLAAHPNIEIRIYNPYVVRGELGAFRWAEFALEGQRLNYRMHNKLFVADNAVAVTGGRNVGDAYFQASTDLELGDFDLLVAGPMVQEMSRSFDLYWNDKLAVPVETLPGGEPPTAAYERARDALAAHAAKMANSDYLRALPKRDLLADVLAGRKKLVWAKATYAYDEPDKAQIARDGERSKFMWHRVASAAEDAQNELIIISPYLVPGGSEMRLLRRLRERGVRVRILTNSLASTDMPIAHAGYIRYRPPLLEAGCELSEVRPLLGEPETEHGLIKSGSSEHFGLHAKVFVIDRQRVFVGSMNFDRRSLSVNTEIGVIIDSPELARIIAARFEAIARPENSYRLALEPAAGGYNLRWTTQVDGKAVSFDTEPDVDAGKRTLIEMLSLLPIDNLL